MALKDKIAIVSGGSRGIGKEIVLALAEGGASVAFTYVSNREAADELVERTEKLPGKVKAYQVDIREQSEVKEMVKTVVKEMGGLDIVVNNAGICKDRSILFLSPDEWDDVLKTNLYGGFYLTQAALFYLLKKKRGRIVNISSISGITGLPGQANYSSSKAGLIGLTRSLAKEVGAHGISINAIAPGGVETDMLESMSASEVEKLVQGVPKGRLCRPEEVAKLAIYLVDDELCPDYLTGTIIPLDGGAGV